MSIGNPYQLKHITHEIILTCDLTEQDGVEIPKEQLPGLKVSVFSTEVEPRTSDSDFPRWLGLTEHKDITGGWAAWGSSDN